jgi:hypothetical protein
MKTELGFTDAEREEIRAGAQELIAQAGQPPNRGRPRVVVRFVP